ncbi:MAG: BrnA antitoxin family protein [Acidovorax sp.]|uniref:BrnA antitoxin family protein n=1 Tax=Acidovorax sp. TaxID=1872122 RepID=UPI0039E5644D
MSKRAPLTDENGEVRELTLADLRHFKPAAEVLDPALYASLLQMNRRAGVRGAQKAPTKVVTTIRLSPDVMDAFKATGAGWQTRIDAALKDWLKSHSPV